MSDLVAHVPDQRPVGFAQLCPPRRAFCVVALGDIEGDEPLGMAGQHCLERPVCVHRVGQEIEGEPGRRVGPGGVGQVPFQDRVEQVPLRLFDIAPVLLIGGLVQIGNGPVVPAGGTKAVFGHGQPVAACGNAVGAGLGGIVGVQRAERLARAVVAEFGPAIETGGIVEMHLGGADGTRESFHDGAPGPNIQAAMT